MITRRVREAHSAFTHSGPIALDDNQGLAYVGSQNVALTRREFQLLRELACQPGQAFSRRKLLDKICDIQWDPMSNLVQVHFHNLREKLGSARDNLMTVRGGGYKLVPRGGSGGARVSPSSSCRADRAGLRARAPACSMRWRARHSDLARSGRG